jgi:hypothetical protein
MVVTNAQPPLNVKLIALLFLALLIVCSPIGSTRVSAHTLVVVESRTTSGLSTWPWSMVVRPAIHTNRGSWTATCMPAQLTAKSLIGQIGVIAL